MRRLLTLLALLPLFSHADIATTENDPSSLVDNVSVITGQFYSFIEDYTVQGYEPIRLRRSFVSGGDHSLADDWLVCSFIPRVGLFWVKEPNGTLLSYEWKGERQGRAPVFRVIDTGSLPGMTNTASGSISARTNLSNQYIVPELPKDKKNPYESFTLFCANGTKRYYLKLEKQKKHKLPGHKEGYHMYHYKLLWEQLPNGNQINYIWGHKNELEKITTSPRENVALTFACLKCPKNDPERFSPRAEFFGSDKRSLLYETIPVGKGTEGQDIFSLTCVNSPEFPKLNYNYHLCGNTPFVEQVHLPNARNFRIEYEGSNQNRRVNRLYAPVGKDDALVLTHTFSYDIQGRNTHVRDAYGNRSVYRWNDQFRLTEIRHYKREEDPLFSERFLWDGIRIVARSHLDATGGAVFARTFEYDGPGNLHKEVFWGNLSGEGASLQLGDNNYPTENGVERYVKTTTYKQDGRNLPEREESGDLVTVYEYRGDCILPVSKTLCGKIQTRYEYTPERVLTREILDDGICQTIQQITPYRSGSYFGLPETIEERYKDGSQEVLLKKTVLHYREGALIDHKDVYDADDRFCYTIQYGYDTKGRITLETNALGEKAISSYDAVGNRVHFQDFGGRLEIFYKYDYSNRLTSKEEVGSDSSRRICTYEYDLKHNLVAETDFHGNRTTYTVDPLGLREETTFPSVPDERGNPISSVLTQHYDSLGCEIFRQDPDGNITTTTYNAYGKPTLITHPDGSQEKNLYYLDGSLKTHTNAQDVTTHYQYDFLKRVTVKTISSPNVFAEERFEYEGLLLKSKTDAERNKTTYGYDKARRKTSEECNGEITLFSYDALGRVHTIQQHDILTAITYNFLDQIVEEKKETTSGKPLSQVFYGYDAAGNKKSITRSVAGTVSTELYDYDPYKRLVKKTDPLDFIETTEYDDPRHEKTHTDPLGLKTIETYDARNHLARVEKRLSTTLSLTDKFYTPSGQIHHQTDTIYSRSSSRQVHTHWEYEHTRLSRLTEAHGTTDAKITSHTYTPLGQLASTTKPDGIVLFYTYDDLGHLISLTSSDGTVRHHMRHNRLGQLIDNDGLIRTYDPKGRLLTETLPQNLFIENRYDLAGRRSSCHIPAADCLIRYAYTGTHLTSVTRCTLAGTPLYTHTYTDYDLSDNLLTSQLIGSLGSIKFRVDPLSRTTQINAPLFQQQLTLDPIGNIEHMSIQQDTTTYTYDELYQLTSETGPFSHTYVYDSLFNRLQKDNEPYQVNDLNQATSHLIYNKNGNPIRQGDTTYTYDALDRLIRIETPTQTQTYTYDSLHRRLSQTTNNTTIYFLYDGQNEIGTFSTHIEQLRILGATPHAEIGASIALELDGHTYAPIHDLQGNIALLLPLDASEPSAYRYSAFGEEQLSGPAVSPWRFASKRTDLNLVCFGRRFYVPTLGRWLTPDPAGFTDGMNLYAYVHNSPLTHFDEYGLEDFAQMMRMIEREKDVRNYQQGGYKFDNHYYHYTPSNYSINKESNKPRGEIVFFNGIRTTFNEHCEMVRYTSKLGGNIPVHGIHMPTHGFINDVLKCRATLNTGINSTVLHGERYFREASERVGPDGKILMIGHSAGGMNEYFAVMRLPKEVREKIIARTIAPAKIIPRGDISNTQNYRSSKLDAVMLYHKTFHKDEYYRALESGSLTPLPAHSDSGFHDHSYMSPTFTNTLIKVLGAFSEEYDCR